MRWDCGWDGGMEGWKLEGMLECYRIIERSSVQQFEFALKKQSYGLLLDSFNDSMIDIEIDMTRLITTSELLFFFSFDNLSTLKIVTGSAQP